TPERQEYRLHQGVRGIRRGEAGNVAHIREELVEAVGGALVLGWRCHAGASASVRAHANSMSGAAAASMRRCGFIIPRAPAPAAARAARATSPRTFGTPRRRSARPARFPGA